MHIIFELAAFVIIGGIAIVILFLVFAISRSGVSKRSSEESVEEAKMIQEIYTGLERMEKRVEALETILLDDTRKEDDNA
jgi:phage shock protein B